MSRNKEFILQHEDTKLALFRYNGTNIETESIVVNDKTTHILPFLSLSSEKLESKIAQWIINRGIPVTRDDIKKDIGDKTLLDILIQNLGLSLTDHYWFNPIKETKSWAEVNLYTNNFKSIYTLDLREDIKDIAGKTNFIPSASLKGDLKKKWIIQISSNGNKVIGCECPNFTDINTEFIPAIEIINSEKKSSSLSYYDQYIQICENRGISYIRPFMEYQILTDFIITNTDRHLNNFGIIRDSNTLEFIKPAPIFDSGNSMFYKSQYIKTGNSLLDIDITSFKTNEIKLLEYITNPNLVDLSLLPTSNELKKLFSIDITSKDEEIERLVKAYEKKIQLLNEFQHGIKIYSYGYKKSNI